VRVYATLTTLTDTAAATMRMAVRSGHAVAEITLHPAELGRVRVTIESHDDGGVTATVTAESREAAQALSQPGRDLRSALEAQGLTVHGLAVQVAPDGDRDGRPGGRPGDRPASGRSAAQPAAGEPEPTIQRIHVGLSSSAVDVLA
jgi:hypothetical protein